MTASSGSGLVYGSIPMSIFVVRWSADMIRSAVKWGGIGGLVARRYEEPHTGQGSIPGPPYHLY
jgi:hypothetical protein